MIKNKAVALIKNLSQDKEARDQSLQLITELAGVAASVSSGNHSFKLQRLISRTTLGFSTAVALRTLIQMVMEHSQEKVIQTFRPEYFVRVFSQDPLFNEIRNHLVKNYTTQVAVDGAKDPHIVMRSMNLTEYYDDNDEEVTDPKDLPDNLRVLVEDAEGKDNVYVYVEPITISDTVLKIEEFEIECLFVDRAPIVKDPKKSIEFTSEWAEPKTRGSRSEDALEKKLQDRDSYLFKCYSIEERRAVQRFLLELGPKAHGVGTEKEEYRGSADIYVADAQGSGSWSSIPARTADTVILPNGLLDTMVKEIRTFLNYEKLYYMLGVPYHHGIMLSGAPGTGKSSAAQAIASELHMQTYSVSLSTLESNDAFLKFIKNVNSNSVILIEDVDVASSVTADRNDKATGVSMETLLNVLDGVLSPHGCVFILTTNHIENFDSAVIRPGRIDATYDITYLVDEQFERLCRKFMQLKPEKELNLPTIEGLQITPADVVGVIKRFIPDIADALPHVVKFVEDKRIAMMESALV